MSLLLSVDRRKHGLDVMTGFHEAGLIPFHTFLQTEFKLASKWSC